jgi:TRAP-type C4-dicarboxylate transport system permease small subunit
MKISIIIGLVIYIGVILFSGNLSISFKPFKISGNWTEMIGMIMFTLGLAILFSTFYSKGANDANKRVIDQIERITNENSKIRK